MAESKSGNIVPTRSLVLFELEGQKYALFLEIVERIVRSAALTPLPKAPDIVLGIVNVRGQVIPVMNTRNRFGHPDRPLATTDFFIIARTRKWTVALTVENILGVMPWEQDKSVSLDTVLPNTDYIAGVVKLREDLVLIHDLDLFLSLEESKALESALSSRKKGN